MICSSEEIVHRLKISAASYPYTECWRCFWGSCWGHLARHRESTSWQLKQMFEITRLSLVKFFCLIKMTHIVMPYWSLPRTMNDAFLWRKEVRMKFWNRSCLTACAEHLNVFILPSMVAYVWLIFHLLLFQHSSTYRAEMT